MAEQIKAVVFDWAGTTIDYGCFAPVKGFIDGFAAIGYEITSEMARKPMGLPKIDHTRAIAAMLSPEITKQQILTAYEVFEQTLFANIEQHCDVKDHVISVVAALKAAGIKVGSTTGYTTAMMARVLPKARECGYIPDFCITPDQALKGRPYPYMIWSNLMQFGIIDPREALKVGDTLADIEEGINANCWTAGVIMGSSELGLCRDEVEAMTESELFERKKQVHAAYYQAGADYIIEDMNQLPGVIADINQRLAMATTRKLLTPGPLTTRYSVKHAMLTDHCTWDDEYKAITASIANDLTKIAAGDESSEYVTILLQGSGSYAVEAMINCLNDKDDRILFLVNGEYGRRMVRMADNAGCSYELLNFEDTEAIDCKIVDNTLRNNPGINSVIFVHCETTTGIINPLKDIARLAKSYGKKVFVDAMSSFGAYEIDMKAFRIDGLASSANKCLEGLPGLSFVIVDRQIIEQSKGKATSLCLDLYEQYRSLYEEGGKFRFTSPTNILLALRQAIDEYMKEGGLPARRARYIKNHTTLVEELRKLDISPLIAADIQSYIITTFELKDIEFTSFYEMLKNNGFIIYPGKLTTVPTFRIGNIGDVYPSDMKRLAEVIGDYLSSFAIRCYYSDPSV